MAGPRQLALPPTFNPRQFGLLSVVQPRYDEPDLHWRNGITYQDTCLMAGSTYDPFCLASGTGTTPAAKASNILVSTFGALPFTVFAEVDCSPVGYSQDEQRTRAVDALSKSEGYQAELVFWTGAAGGDAGVVYPHLAADTAVVDATLLPNVQLQCAVTAVSGTAAFEVTEAIGRLEALMGACYGGQIVLHVPLILAERLISSAMVSSDGGVMRTKTGNLVAVGAGYPGTSPAQASTPGAAWVYATAPVMAYRGGAETFTFKEMFDRSSNTVKTIVERTYLLAFPCCCVYGVPVTLSGGVPL